LKQLEILSELFIDLAKGLFLASLAVPVIAKEGTVLDSLRSVFVGIFSAYLSLKTIAIREDKR